MTWSSAVPDFLPSALLVPRYYPPYVVCSYWICTMNVYSYVLASAKVQIVEASYVVSALRLVISRVMVRVYKGNVVKSPVFVTPVYEVVHALEPLESFWSLPYVVNPYLYPVFWDIVGFLSPDFLFGLVDFLVVSSHELFNRFFVAVLRVKNMERNAIN